MVVVEEQKKRGKRWSNCMDVKIYKQGLDMNTVDIIIITVVSLRAAVVGISL